MTASAQQLDPRLAALLSGLRWRIRAYVWLEGLALGVIWLGLTFWVALALDYLPVLAGANEMPRAARAVVLAIVAAGLAYILYHWVFRRAFVPLANRSMAVLLERRFGVFRDSLVTSVELTERPDHAETFDFSMLAHTSQEALSDVGVRRALGASRARVFGQHLVEVGLLGAFGGLLGLALAWAGLLGVRRLYVDYERVAHLNAELVAIAIGLAIVAGLAAGLYPAWRICRIQPATSLKTQ